VATVPVKQTLVDGSVHSDMIHQGGCFRVLAVNKEDGNVAVDIGTRVPLWCAASLFVGTAASGDVAHFRGSSEDGEHVGAQKLRSTEYWWSVCKGKICAAVEPLCAEEGLVFWVVNLMSRLFANVPYPSLAYFIETLGGLLIVPVGLVGAFCALTSCCCAGAAPVLWAPGERLDRR